MERLHNITIPENNNWDLIVIGGGATGLGTALDASSRGFKTLLVEQSDFAKGTSSRSTKLVHGGVRYLAQGDIGLVKHALKERGLLQHNANHLVDKEAFIIPCYDWFSVAKYLIGLTLYDWLSGKFSFGKSKFFSKKETLEIMPGIKSKGLKGSIRYFDGKFDDARLAINIAQTAVEQGATLLNYTKVTNLVKDSNSKIIGIETEDTLTGKKASFRGKVVINATGVFVDDILQMNNPQSKKLVRPSQGVHIVIEKSFLNSDSALMIPKTSDGRVLFAVPWHDHLLVGTTDTPLDEHSLEPRALKQEVDFIMNTASAYFDRKPLELDILSVFSGLRPLAAPTSGDGNSTKEISRDHKLMVSAKGLITITGGKWTTYRRMAEETVDLAISHAGLEMKACITENLKIHGCTDKKAGDHLDIYGSDRVKIEALMNAQPELKAKLHPKYPYTEAEVVWSARYEMAETVEDILSRRLRILFIDAHVAKEMSTKVASLLAEELKADKNWESNQIETFNKLADGYIYNLQNYVK
ncbi:glycerol-3-phosphate dehydrogenase/oxidase [Pedobacter fastidiosus]|uniref:Glycerol-3-phosphate dehydrogenase/oxidase n=1 Tax=Pedobacter fastidiosus TaxID=2765361 RepID=A0ABR7KMR7_9SPHI|nr:glycerol-3-phosphate dehydrogenase/oxidase [Pedobacter fastidiosus]MBC6109351.1 glycerol-3-phosphate dehydrogenase/oxidase [Pedobacter fastidiosus]